jgi:capsular polysaccharide transport system ATP-binding protein
VSHQVQTLEKFCRSAAVLKDGTLHMFETLEEARRKYEHDERA